MKTTLLAIGLAVAAMPLTFAAQAPSAPATNNTTAPATTGAKTKHVKKTPKTKKSTTPASTAPAAQPAPAK